jgi:transposase
MEITPEQYENIRERLPVQRGNVRLTNLQVLNAILYVAEQGCKWRGFPRRFGNWHTIYGAGSDAGERSPGHGSGLRERGARFITLSYRAPDRISTGQCDSLSAVRQGSTQIEHQLTGCTIPQAEMFRPSSPDSRSWTRSSSVSVLRPGLRSAPFSVNTP